MAKITVCAWIFMKTLTNSFRTFHLADHAMTSEQDIVRLATQWTKMSNKSRSRLLRKLTAAEKLSLRTAIRAAKAEAEPLK